jgi:hypothetical protein
MASDRTKPLFQATRAGQNQNRFFAAGMTTKPESERSEKNIAFWKEMTQQKLESHAESHQSMAEECRPRQL